MEGRPCMPRDLGMLLRAETTYRVFHAPSILSRRGHTENLPDKGRQLGSGPGLRTDGASVWEQRAETAWGLAAATGLVEVWPGSQMEVGRAEGQILKPTGLSVLEAVLDSHKVGDKWTCVQPLGPPLALYLVVRAASRTPEEACESCLLLCVPLWM